MQSTGKSRKKPRRISELTGKADKEVLAYVDSMYEDARQSRLTFERQWYLNLAFYFGKQWVTWAGSRTSGTLTRLYEPRAPSWRVRLVSNRIRKIARTEMSKITREHPTAFVIPDTTDDSDLAAARAGESVYEHVSRDVKLPLLTRRAAFWVVTCGTGFIKDWWDQGYQDDANKGRITADIVSPFHLLVPDLAEELFENQSFVAHAMAKDPAWVYRNFGIEVPGNTRRSGRLDRV
jgi:hypothetical protein